MDPETTSIKLNFCFGCMRQLDPDQVRCPSCGNDNTVRCNPEDALPEGSVLNGKYLVGKVLGRGGFGITYLGFDLILRIRVAIKEYFPVGASMRVASSYNVLSLSNSETTSAFAKGCNVFLNEAQTLAVFNSPYIVHVREVFKEHGTAYIIMDYVDGVTLTKAVADMGGKMPVHQMLSLMKPLIQQLAVLHRQKIIHRDIKPDNIMLVNEEETGEEHLVLLDFGAARSFISENVTRTYTAVVTPGFAPLEQYSEKSRQGPYTDVYALCATMYYLLSGQAPTAVHERINGISLKTFQENGVQIPAQIEKAIMHGLTIKSDDRIQTMQQLYKELLPEENPVQRVSPPKVNPAPKIKQKPDTESTSITKSGSRKSLLIALTCIVVVALIGLVGGIIFSKKNSGPESQYKKAVSFMNKEQYSEAEEVFESLDDYKDSAEKLSETRYLLGLSYETGSDDVKNERLALSYYQLAADDGYADAINKLGECAYYGVGRSQNYKEAFAYFEEASDLGSVDAYYNLGLCYENGHGTEKNEKTAMAYYNIAADEGSQEAVKKVKK